MELIATNYFSSVHHDTLQELWLSAVYGFSKAKRGKAPNAVDRYALIYFELFPIILELKNLGVLYSTLKRLHYLILMAETPVFSNRHNLLNSLYRKA